MCSPAVCGTAAMMSCYATGDSTSAVPRRFVHEHARGVPGRMAVELRHVIHGYSAAESYDIVHDHTLAGPFYSAQFPDLPVVTTNHGLFDEDLSDIYRAIGARVPVIAISHAQAGSADDVRVERVIHHGIDVQRMPFGRGDGGYLLFLGRMSSDKGAHRRRPDRAHRAPAAAHRGQDPRAGRARLLRGPGRAAPRRRRRVCRRSRRRRKGAPARGARALLNPIAWDEPFGLVMIEAPACGTPVLAFLAAPRPRSSTTVGRGTCATTRG